jgi:hypothetical protein
VPVTLDDRRLTITGNDLGVLGGWSHILWVHGRSGSFRMHSHPRGSAEIMAEQDHQSRPVTVREASWERHRLLAQEHQSVGGTTLVWQGDFNELSTYVHGIDVPLEVLVDRLKLLDLTDTQDGLVVRAALGTGTTVSYGLAANFIADLCGITVRPVESVPDLPAGGHPVQGGRVWRDEAYDRGRLSRRLILIANESALTTLSPFNPEDDRLRPLVESIDVRLN